MVIPLGTHESFPAPAGEPHARGRPALHENRRVAEDIIRAAETCLEYSGPQQITIKEVAALAGVRPSMVPYYFGGMKGLLDEILRRGLKEILNETSKLREAILRNEVDNPLRAMIVMFAESYNQRPALMRILISGTLREKSTMRNFLVYQWPAYGKLMLEDVLSHLAASGHYRKDIDVEGIGTMIRGAVFYPIIIKPYLASKSTSIKHYLDDRWIDFVTAVFECYLRPA